MFVLAGSGILISGRTGVKAGCQCHRSYDGDTPYRPHSAPQLCAHYHRLSRGDHRQPTAGQGDRLDIYRPWMLLLWAIFRPFSAAL